MSEANEGGGSAERSEAVFARESGDPDARPRFHRLPPPSDDDVRQLLTTIARRTTALLRRRGRLDDDLDPDDLQLAFERFAAHPPASGPFVPAPLPDLCARLDGFSLHAARAVHEHDRAGLERLLRYCARPALSLDRLSLLPDGRVRYQFKRAFSDGRTHVLLSPHDFLARLCALVAPPRAHLVRYFGAFAPRARGRAALTGRPSRSSSSVAAGAPAPHATPSPPGSSAQTAPAAQPAAPPCLPAASPSPSPPSLGDPPPDPSRSRRLDWASLLRRVFAIDVLRCARCAGHMIVIAYLTDPAVTARILRHLGLPPVARPRPVAASLRLRLEPFADDDPRAPADPTHPPPCYDPAVDPPAPD